MIIVDPVTVRPGFNSGIWKWFETDRVTVQTATRHSQGVFKLTVPVTPVVGI
jgi:hypothetical protein